MVHFMAKKSPCYKLPAALLNITSKADMSKFLFLPQTFHSLCRRKIINFTSTFYESQKVIIP